MEDNHVLRFIRELYLGNLHKYDLVAFDNHIAIINTMKNVIMGKKLRNFEPEDLL